MTITLLLIVWLTLNFEMVRYGYLQARGQLKITFSAVDVEDVLNDADFPDSLKAKINLIGDVREYAINELGLNDSENYTTYYDQQGKALLWNLSASEPYQLKPHLWKFPFLGSFPYKGFFHLEEAKKEREELLENGYDVRIRSVGGWSTLGWTKDPILSNMLKRPTGSLTELIIHELTHSTLFVADNIKFNENLATFIGEIGARKYLISKYGKNSYEYVDYIQSEEDSKRYIRFILHATKQLDSTYHNIHDLNDSLKFEAKKEMIEAITQSIDTVHFHQNKYYNFFDRTQPNNAYFMSFLRYYSAEDSLKELYAQDYQSDITLFIEGMKAYHGK